MGQAVFNFAAGVYPKESRIARAKQSAVGGKRKRCTKGKNCSAACIAANMVCLVDLPWVGPSLTKAAAQIMAMKGKAPAAAKATPATKSAPTSKAAPVPAATPKPAPAAKPAANSTPAPATKPATKPQPTVKVETVEKYKSFGLPFLEKALPISEGSRVAQTPEGKKAIANIKQAIAELKAEPPKMAPGAQTVIPAAKPTPAPAAKTASAKAAAAAAPKPAPPATTPAPQPAAKPAATPTTASTSAPAAKSAATLPVKAGSQALDIYKYDSGNFGKFYDDAQKLGLTKQEAQDFFFNWIKTKNNNMAIDSKDMPAFVKDFNKAAGLSTPAAKPAATAAPAPKAANPATKPAQATSTYTNWDTKDLVKFQNSFMSDPVKYKAAIDEIQRELDARGYQKPTIPKIPYAKPGTKDNRQELNEGQYRVWSPFFKPFTSASLEDYKQTGSAYYPKTFTPGTLEHKQNQIIKKAHSTSEPWGLIKSSTTKAELPQVASVQKAVDNLGLDRVKYGLSGIRNFTGIDYTKIRAAQRGQVPREYDYLSDKAKQDMINKYKKKADDIEAVLGYMQKPQVPKMRGVAADDTKLANLVHLAKTGGSMKELSMNSWSTNSRTPQQFAQDGVDNGYGNNHVIFRTLNKKGASIKEMSGIQSEDEILTPANTSYRFSGYNTVVGEKGRTYHVFDMVEY